MNNACERRLYRIETELYGLEDATLRQRARMTQEQWEYAARSQPVAFAHSCEWLKRQDLLSVCADRLVAESETDLRRVQAEELLAQSKRDLSRCPE